MSEVLSYRKHHQRDWMTSTTVLQMTFAARGIYMALLDLQWENRGVPESEDAVGKILRATPEEWADFAPFFDECFPICDDGKRRNPRLEAERMDADALVQRNRENGTKGGRPKTQTKPTANPPLTQSKPKTNPKQSHTETDTYTDTITPKPPKGELIVRSGGSVTFLGHELPFSSEKFITTWMEWVQHRKEIGKPITPTAAKRQFAKCRELGEAVSLSTIGNAITQGYQGLYESKPEKQAGGKEWH